MSDRRKVTQAGSQSSLETSPEGEHFVDFREATRRRMEEDAVFRREFEAERLKLAIATALNNTRDRAGLSQSELAKKCGTTQPMLSRFFSGEDDRSPTLETLVKIADALGKVIHIELVDQPSSQFMTWTKPEVLQPQATQWNVHPEAAITEDSLMAVSVGRRWKFQRHSTDAAISEEDALAY